MRSKAGLAWKVRGFPHMVKTKIQGSFDQFLWCCESLGFASWIKVSDNEWVFKDQSDAVMFDLAWGMDNDKDS